MSKINYIKNGIKATIFTTGVLFFTNEAAAEIGQIDLFTFCNNTCKIPHCKESIKTDCLKKCDPVWIKVAELQMANSAEFGKIYRTETPDNKKAMLCKSPIAVGSVR